METMNYDGSVPKAKDVKDTRMLEPNANQQSIYTTGENNIKRDKTSHKPFGKLGVKGHPA